MPGTRGGPPVNRWTGDDGLVILVRRSTNGGIMHMGRGWRTAMTLLCGVTALAPVVAVAEVELRLQPVAPSVPYGRFVDVELYAVSTDGTGFNSMDVVLVWNPDDFVLEGVTPSLQHSWDFLFGLLPDDSADGLNNALDDGDALFQAASFLPAAATPDGLLVATFQFMARRDVADAPINMADAMGVYSFTGVFQAGGADVTGALTGAAVTISSAAHLWALDVTTPAGRVVAIPVWGQIEAQAAYGLTVGAELVAAAGNVGTVQFTPAPPPDIGQLGDPWPGAGVFTGFDSDSSGTASTAANGAVDDNGTYVPSPVSFSGPLIAFPVTTTPEALGTWHVRLCVGGCGAGGEPSRWDSIPDAVPTGLGHAVFTVVVPGDGDASSSIDAHDAAQLQACFTGDIGPVVPPAYAVAGSGSCAAYDFDNDGDVDVSDWNAFQAVMAGPH